MSEVAKPPIDRIPNVSRAEQVAGELSSRIRSGAFAPGTRLPGEHATAEQFGVSRAVVREAIARLKTEGLIRTRQGDGAFVGDWRTETLHLDPGISQDLESVLMIVELRKGLEAEAAALAALRHSDVDMAAIETARSRASEIAAARGDSVVADIAFHRAIAEATGNPYYGAVLDYLTQFVVPAIRASRGHAALREDVAREVDAEHLAIANAIRRRDRDAARAAAQTHMDHASARIRRAGREVLPRDTSRRGGKAKVPRPSK
jgi:GntR family transcriptional regulator, transcriptional repressor for pyruvate dehydrogenase complex